MTKTFSVPDELISPPWMYYDLRLGVFVVQDHDTGDETDLSATVEIPADADPLYHEETGQLLGYSGRGDTERVRLVPRRNPRDNEYKTAAEYWLEDQRANRCERCERLPRNGHADGCPGA